MKCGKCTLCCKLLETHDIKTNRGEICPYCNEWGCMIYNDRPKECREYKCMWLQMDDIGIEMRPDKCHVIFDRISDKTICAAQDPDYNLNDFVKRQINLFLKEGFSVVIIKGDKKTVYVSKGHSFEEAKRDVINQELKSREILNK